MSNVGQKVKVRQHNMEYYGVLYQKIRLIDVKISAFKEQIETLKTQDKPKVQFFSYFKQMFKEQKLNPLINVYNRDIWDLEIERRTLIDLYRACNKEDEDVIIFDVEDIISYVGWLYEQDKVKFKNKIVSILSKVKIIANSPKYNKLQELKTAFLAELTGVKYRYG